MELRKRVDALAKLGEFLRAFIDDNSVKNELSASDLEFENLLTEKIEIAKNHNPWFTKENIYFSLNRWSNILTNKNIKSFINKYNFKELNPRTIALVTAGNIPLVGFHDFFCVLISGHRILIKQSSNDSVLLPFLSSYLEHIEPEFKGTILFTNEKLQNFDAVIATGSNNTSRYFEYYFKSYPSIIRKNRNSVAILTGNETVNELDLLSEDIFRYYGLGCRNVSKIYVPKEYNFDRLFNALYKWNPIINEHKYANNYDYNKAVYLMSEYHILDNGFFMLKEDASMASPIATLNYEYYEDKNELISNIKNIKNEIQCIVSRGVIKDEIPFGTSQMPTLNDFADGIDTVDFLLKI